MVECSLTNFFWFLAGITVGWVILLTTAVLTRRRGHEHVEEKRALSNVESIDQTTSPSQ